LKKTFILLLLSLYLQNVVAQKLRLTITYPIALPTGNLNDYISKMGYPGVCVEFAKRQTPWLDIGIEASWISFYQQKNDVIYTDRTVSVSGDQYRYTNTIPALLVFKYQLDPAAKSVFSPYVGLGTGVLFVNRSVDFGLYQVTSNSWHFCLSPQAGVSIKAEKGPAAVVSVKYYNGLKSGDVEGQSYLSLNIGVEFPFRYK
jgi:outer membrane protein W